jgi:drug/metabolite transporter (DMT)-like permease
VTTGQYVVGGLVLLAISFGAEGTDGADWDSGVLWLVVAFTAIIASALATVTFFAALRRLSATAVSAWLFLSPVVAVLLEIALGHTPKTSVFAGMVLTIVGVAVVTRAPPPQVAPDEALSPRLSSEP